MSVELDGVNNVLKTDTISEVTSANGVTVDGLSIKDSKLVTANSVIEANMSANSVDSDSYVDGSIDTVHIADLNVTTGKIAADAITGAKIADDAINSEHYTDGSIDTAHIADNQITLAKMAGGTDGNIISYDASGDPVAIATGNDGQVLTSTGAGSAPAFETLSSGKVLQVLSTTKVDTFSTTSTSFTDITGMTLAITPSSTSSKVYIFAEIKHNGLGQERDYFRLLRDSTAICIGNAAGNRPRISAGGIQSQTTYTINGESIMFLDSPSSTSAVTYKIQMLGINSGTSYVNRSEADRNTSGYEARTASTITVMEIGS